jgi:hypothetical protein
MSGRGQDHDRRGRRGGIGIGRGLPPPAREAQKSETKFKGIDPDLPSLSVQRKQAQRVPQTTREAQRYTLQAVHCTSILDDTAISRRPGRRARHA